MHFSTPHWLTFSLALLPFFSDLVFSQTDELLEVRGIVQEVTEQGAPKPLAGVIVTVRNQHYDITDDQGRFTLLLPPANDHVFLELENTPHPMIAPRDGYLPLPPDGHIYIKVCAKENEKLRAKVEKLNQKLKEVERKHRLTKRQMARMHEQMLDKILHLEQQTDSLKQALRAAGETISAVNEQLLALQKKNAQLEAQLLHALEEKYLRQQQYQREIASTIEAYIVHLKDLRDWLRRFDYYFQSPGAQKDFIKTNSAYEKTWEKLNLNHTNYLLHISNYWDSQLLRKNAEDLFNFALTDIHDRIIIGQYNREVIEPLQQSAAQTYSNKLRKKAKAGAAQTLLLLNAAIPRLEEQSHLLLRQLIENT